MLYFDNIVRSLLRTVGLLMKIVVLVKAKHFTIRILEYVVTNVRP